jgi:hypothetical protein
LAPVVIALLVAIALTVDATIIAAASVKIRPSVSMCRYAFHFYGGSRSRAANIAHYIVAAAE